MPAILTALLTAVLNFGDASQVSNAVSLPSPVQSFRPISPGIRIAWDRATLRRVSHPRFGYACYGRMIPLRDGALLAIYEADGSIMAARSTDGARTWGEPAAVAWAQDGITMAAPDVLELQDGSLLACYNPRPWKISPRRTFGIRTRRSTDGGRTWNQGRLVYEAGHKFGDGCWEPAAIQQPDGEVRLFFANEGTFRLTNEQNISMLTSSDGGLTWTTQPKVISYRPFKRDGMPAPLRLANGDEVIAIEDLGLLGTFHPAILRSPDGQNWASLVEGLSPRREWPLPGHMGYHDYGGAPYLRQLPSGETLLSYQGAEGRPPGMHHAEMKVAIGDSEARNFGRVTAPFNLPKDRSGLWNSIAIPGDGTIIALTSTAAFSGKQEVWMIRGRVLPPVQVPAGTPTIDGMPWSDEWTGGQSLRITDKPGARLTASLMQDDKALYLRCRVTDKSISTGNPIPEQNDGVIVNLGITQPGLEGEASIFTRPSTGMLSVFIGADGTIVPRAGHRGYWLPTGYNSAAATSIRAATVQSPVGYNLEVAVPWSALGITRAHADDVVINLTVADTSSPSSPPRLASLSSADPNQPETWLPVSVISPAVDQPD